MAISRISANCSCNLVNNFSRSNFPTIVRKTSDYTAVLKYWFGDDLSAVHSPLYSPNNKLWFSGSAEIDKEIETKFSELLKKAEADELTEWRKSPHGELALIILLDQFSRNIYRDSADSFKNDNKALEIAMSIVDDDKKCVKFAPVEKNFLYLPFEHSEDKEVHKKSVALYENLVATAAEEQKKFCAEALEFAREHKELIERYE